MAEQRIELTKFTLCPGVQISIGTRSVGFDSNPTWARENSRGMKAFLVRHPVAGPVLVFEQDGKLLPQKVPLANVACWTEDGVAVWARVLRCSTIDC
jgi:hypothetical protein